MGFSAFQAKADIVLSEVIVDFVDSKEVRKDIVVQNIGNKKVFVAVQPYQIEDPVKDKSKRIPLKDPRKSTLVATPNRMILKPKQKRNLRIIVSKRNPEKDMVYRVRVVPKVGKLAMEGEVEGNAKQTGVKVLVGYDVLVMVRPPVIKQDYSISRLGNKLFYENKGNTNFLIREIQQCDNFEEQTNCEKVNGPRVYAGAKGEMTLKRNATAKIFLKFHDVTAANMY